MLAARTQNPSPSASPGRARKGRATTARPSTSVGYVWACTPPRVWCCGIPMWRSQRAERGLHRLLLARALPARRRGALEAGPRLVASLPLVDQRHVMAPATVCTPGPCWPAPGGSPWLRAWPAAAQQRPGPRCALEADPPLLRGRRRRPPQRSAPARRRGQGGATCGPASSRLTSLSPRPLRANPARARLMQRVQRPTGLPVCASGCAPGPPAASPPLTQLADVMSPCGATLVRGRSTLRLERL
jgi:hypothetical protein